MSTDQTPERDEASEAGPWTDYPSADYPNAGYPAAGASGVPAQQPWPAASSSAPPSAAQPAAAQPAAAQPAAAQPSSAQPFAAQPFAAQPSAGQPFSAGPATQPFSAQPGAGQPSAAGYPATGAPNWPVSGAPQPMDAAQTSGPPHGMGMAQTSGPPHAMGMAQTSGPPHAMGMGQTSGPPHSWSVQEPAWADPLAGGLDNDPSGYQRRIVPTAPRRKSRLLLGILIGFLAGVLVAAPTAFFLAPGDDGTPAPTPSAGPANPPALGAFEQNQLALNRPKFQNDLATLAASWLPFVTNCLTSGEPGGPKIGMDERAHVLCRYGNAYVHFAQFKSPLERDRARAYRQRLNAEAQALAPGVAAPARTPRSSDQAVGTYIEYALQGSDKKTTAGVWWDSEDDRGVAIYIEASWDQILGKSWEPLRDLWQRHS